MSPIHLRPATGADLPFVRNCAFTAYAPYVERIGREPAPMVADFATHLANGELFIVENTAPIGYSVHRLNGETLFVENVAIVPDQQDGGVGRRVFTLWAELASARGAKRIKLYTNAMMTEALSFYDRLGFQVTDQRIEDGFDRIYLSKDL